MFVWPFSLFIYLNGKRKATKAYEITYTQWEDLGFLVPFWSSNDPQTSIQPAFEVNHSVHFHWISSLTEEAVS